MPVTPAARQDAPDVRTRILDAGFAVLSERGIRHVTQTQVAERAGVRQSHLTYYFPTRDELLEAITMGFVDRLAAGVGRAVGGRPGSRPGLPLARLLEAVAEPGHMRALIGMIVEADGDPGVRSIVVRGTERMVASLAGVLGGEDAEEQARLVLATMWGLGLYRFAVRPPAASDPSRASLAWLDDARRRGKAAGRPTTIRKR
jgi:AcrR family transcriptional regulator